MNRGERAFKVINGAIRAFIQGRVRAGIALTIVLGLGCGAGLGAGAGGSAPPTEIGTATPPLQGNLTVFAAASLSLPFTQIAESLEAAHPGLSVTINFDGSQRLRSQLEHGAQADLFASADWTQMEKLAAADLLQGHPTNFIGNQLAFLVNSSFAPNPEARRAATVSPSSGKGSAESTAGKAAGNSGGETEPVALPDLTQPGVKIALAMPEAPIGRYSEAFIYQLSHNPDLKPDFQAQLLANVVSRESNVRSVAQKVALGEVDAGIAYRTDALNPNIAPYIRVLPIPDSFNVTAQYPIAVLGQSANPELARSFIAFIKSAAGQEILAEYGFEPLPAPAASDTSGGPDPDAAPGLSTPHQPGNGFNPLAPEPGIAPAGLLVNDA